MASVLGHLDTPARDSVLRRGLVSFHGWAWSKASPVSRIDVRFNDQVIGRAGLYRPRPDVATALENEDAAFAGFEFSADLRQVELSDNVSVSMDATLFDGTHAELFSASFRVEFHRPRAVQPTSQTRSFADCREHDAVRVLIVARSLDFGGTQLRMAELVRHLRASGEFEVTIVALADGPLREPLREVGAQIELIKIPVDDLAAYDAAMEKLVAWADQRFDVVYGAHLTSFAAIAVANRLSRPSILRVGEVESLALVADWLRLDLHRDVEDRAYTDFHSASVIIFNSRAARTAHRSYGMEGRLAVLKEGTHLEPISDFTSAVSRESCRAKLGVANDRRLMVCAGTAWPIKGQIPLTLALDRLKAELPDLDCVMVGQRVEPYASALQQLIERQSLGNRIRVLPYCPDIRMWWRAADLAVSVSESESLSASALEALAFGVPVLASRVGGTEEIVTDGETGWLFEACDMRALDDGLRRAGAATKETLVRMGEEATRQSKKRDRQRSLKILSDVLMQLAYGTDLCAVEGLE